MTDWDAIVIGAGPAGSVAARQLALSGRRVLLLDKKRFPRRKVCGACLNHSAVTLLEQIGLGDVVRECDGPEIHRIELRAASRRLNLSLPTGRAISRAVLDQRLVDAAIRTGVTFQDGVQAAVGNPVDDRRIVECWRAGGVSPPVDEAVIDPIFTGGLTPNGTRFVSGTALAAGNSLKASAIGLTPPARQKVVAKVVLAADGLGHPSLCGLADVREHVAEQSRLGAGCEVTDFPTEYVPGVIHMAVGRGGYVGLVRVESGALNVAAAFDARLVRDAGGPARAAAIVLAQAGFPAIPAMVEAEWLGTPTLTRSTTPVAAERLFVLGDAAGYVEPFTGEGIGWALASSVTLAPIADQACEGWQPVLAKAWSREHARIVRRRQRTCRMLAAILKSPTCVRLAMFLLPKMPSLLRPIVHGVSLPWNTRLACLSNR